MSVLNKIYLDDCCPLLNGIKEKGAKEIKHNKENTKN